MRIIQYYPNTRGFSAAFGLTQRSPWTGLESEIDRLVASALSGVSGAVGDGRFPVDLYEDEQNAYVRAELPGVKREDIGVEMVEDSLNISATRKAVENTGGESFSFARSIGVPEAIQADKVSAAYENGILLVTLPKHAEVQPKKVSIAVQ